MDSENGQFPGADPGFAPQNDGQSRIQSPKAKIWIRSGASPSGFCVVCPAASFRSGCCGVAILPQYTLGAALLIVMPWLAFASAVRTRSAFLADSLESPVGIREGDFSIRASGARRDDRWANSSPRSIHWVRPCREQRLDALERRIVAEGQAEIDVVVFTFDEIAAASARQSSGRRLLARPTEQLLGRTASELVWGIV